MEQPNKRIVKGTEHTQDSGSVKIGGAFTLKKSPEFLAERLKVFTELYTKQQENQKTLPRIKIDITLKDGKIFEGTSFETTPWNVAEKKLPQKVYKEVLAAKVLYSKRVLENNDVVVDTDVIDEEGEQEKDNFELWDLNRPLEGDCSIEFVTKEDKEGKTVLFHSSAHILGSALENIYGANLCIGPPLEGGFYYDCYMGSNVVTDSHYKEIEEFTNKFAKDNYPYERLTLTKEEALRMFKDNPFKVSLITNKVPNNGKTSAYRCGNLIDLCLGPHVKSTGVIKVFKVTKHSSCYWLGNDENDSLQRVYGVSFQSESEKEVYEKLMREMEERDHRHIGNIQDLFMWDDLSPGSCFFFPNGAYIYNKLIQFMRNEYQYRGFQEVVTPNMYNINLWKTSGHYKNYSDNLFLLKVDNHGFGLKPMNCPGHCVMFNSRSRSYKELPLRMADFGVLHRNEVSGALSGLTRVRRFQQDDAHIFCAPDQIKQEVLGQLEFIDYVYSLFGYKYDVYLSTRPKKKYIGSLELWDKAEKALEETLNEFCTLKGKTWKFNHGDGAFYGPKIDTKLYDALGRTHQSGTIQLDFQLPIRFNLSFRTDEVVKYEEEELKEKEKAKKDKKDKKKKKGEGKEGEAAEGEAAVTEVKSEVVEHVSAKPDVEDNCGLAIEHYHKDDWDENDFTWREQALKPGFARPVMIHRAILGSVERFFAILTEHFGGEWPFWISPRQVMVIPISIKTMPYAEKIHNRLVYEGYRSFLNKSNKTLEKKILMAEEAHYNFMVIVGEKEESTGKVNLRLHVEGEFQEKKKEETKEVEVAEKDKKVEAKKGGKKGAEAKKEVKEEKKKKAVIEKEQSIPELLEYFRSLEPEKSSAQRQVFAECFKESDLCTVQTHDEIEKLEKRLKFDLFLGGFEPNSEDKTLYALYKGAQVQKETYPSIFKWRLLMEKFSH